MTDADKILQILADMQRDIKSLQEGQKAFEQGQKALQTDVKDLRKGQETLELKVEAFYEEQKQANTQILTTLTSMTEINAKDIDTRVTRIENHLNLPPVK